ncbi:MAG: F0F1 ATP synthase subunit A [Bacteroidales bacterium]
MRDRGHYSFLWPAMIVIALALNTPINGSEVPLDRGHGQDAPRHQEEKPDETGFDATPFIMDHIGDSHEWHLFTTPDGKHVSIPLPVIVWTKERGLSIFSSAKLSHSHIHKGYMIPEEGELKGSIVMVDNDGIVIPDKFILDLSVTKTVTAMMVSALILIWLFVTMARSYNRYGISPPKGIQGFLEPVVLFIRDDIALPNIGKQKYEQFMPYLLTVFFFILINNLMGLIPIAPGGANVTGNIAVTMVLALFTFFVTQISGNRNYWRHIFNTPGIPFWLKPIMIPVELIGLFSKPFALMVRLFANITAGHIIILSLVSLIFIFGSLVIAPVSVFLVLFMNLLEMLVAFIQAYVFTLLSALFIGLAVQEEH